MERPRQEIRAQMIVMPANNTGVEIGYLAGRYEGRLGHLYSPGSQTGPYSYLPYALDNGAFPAFLSGKPWTPEPWRKLASWAKLTGQAPRWILVPDVVGDKVGTLKNWKQYHEEAEGFGWPLAFAAQDGMTFSDVPKKAEVVFLGGSTTWKRQSIGPWCKHFKRVHVGRVNTYSWLWYCHDAGAESVDGTGWARGGKERIAGLKQYLKEAAGEKTRPIQGTLKLRGPQ